MFRPPRALKRASLKCPREPRPIQRRRFGIKQLSLCLIVTPEPESEVKYFHPAAATWTRSLRGLKFLDAFLNRDLIDVGRILGLTFLFLVGAFLNEPSPVLGNGAIEP